MAEKKTTKSATESRRKSQLEQITDVIDSLSTLSSDLRKQQQTLELLQSVSAGLYEEVDKLAKKSPADQISSLVLTQVNDVIREAKDLASNDPFMKRYTEFVAAGDNPEHRDVVVMLRQIRQGLERFATLQPAKKKKTDGLLSDAKGIRVALLFFHQGHVNVNVHDLAANNVGVTEYWQRYKDGFHYFSFDKLDSTDIPTHFHPPE